MPGPSDGRINYGNYTAIVRHGRFLTDRQFNKLYIDREYSLEVSFLCSSHPHYYELCSVPYGTYKRYPKNALANISPENSKPKDASFLVLSQLTLGALLSSVLAQHRPTSVNLRIEGLD